MAHDDAGDELIVTCPHCGSDELEEINTMLTHLTVTHWVIEEGALVAQDFGHYRDIAETVEATGDYYCNGCDHEVPLEQLLVNGQPQRTPVDDNTPDA